MNIDEFRDTLQHEQPPAGLSLALQALWHQARGYWEAAHKLAQQQDDETGAWVHAHLHRVEGDERNAGYWYRRAGRDPSETTLDAEWAEISTTLLGR